MPISKDQLRAGRSLLGLSQSELAEKVGMTAPQLSNYEKGSVTPNPSSMSKLKNVMQLLGLEFLEDDGVKRKPAVVSLKGIEGFRAFMDNVYETAKEIGGDLCLFNTQPELWIKHLGQDWYDMHNERMKKLGDKINVRIITKEGNQNFILDCAQYRWFATGRFYSAMFYCYGEKLGLLNFNEENIEITVISKTNFARGFRELFESAWNFDSIPARGALNES